jgi:ATPase/histidine kinase/DNA gyrase B/HSP90 domain protein
MNFCKQKYYADNLLNVLPNGIITMLPDGKILHINLEAQGELHVNASSSKKYQDGELHISDLLYLVHEEQEMLSRILEELNKGKSKIDLPPNTCIREKATNTLFPVRGQFFSFPVKEGVTEIAFYFHNVTNELTQEYILNTAIRRTKIYPWFLDIDRGVFVLDPRYFEYLGIEPEPGNSLGMETYMNMVHPDDRQPLIDAFSVQFSGEVIYDKPVPFRLSRGNGQWEWFEGQSTYIGKLSGLPYRLVGICMSIQEHKNIEESLIAARNKAEESDRLKSAFLANMSHEIRTPLNAIVGFSDILVSALGELSEEECQDYISLIKTNSSQLLMLISDILDLAKIESNTMNFIFSRTSLNSVFDSVFQEQKFNNHPNTQDVNLELDLPPEIIYIVTDYQRLKQVLNNLVNNAFKFTTEGSIRIGFDLTDNGVLLFVEDTGKGISQEHVERIFDRFYKIDSFIAGTGLGLSICKTIIERLQGDISVQSEVGKGSRFTIHLPLDMDIPESE